MAKLSTSDVVARSSEVLAQPIDGDMVLMHFQSGEYYALRSSSLRIWELMEVPTTIEKMIDSLEAEVNAPREVIMPDVLEFLDQMLEKQLITVNTKE